MFYYLYKVTNLVNNRFYVGVRRSSKSPEVDSYMGSGKVLKQAQKRYGIDSFRKEILETFDTMAAAYGREAEIVTEEFIKDPLVYNLVPGGKGGDHWSSLPNKDEIQLRRTISVRQRFSSMTKEEKSLKHGSVGEKNGFFKKSHSKTTNDVNRIKHAKFEYQLTSPTNESYNTISLKHFCEQHSLNRDTLMYFMNKGIIPASNCVGPKPKNDLRANTTGWIVTKSLL